MLKNDSMNNVAESVVSERIRLQDTTCPLIRLDTARKRDKSVSFSLSLFLHILIFFLVGVSLINPPQFAIDQGVSSLEVNLLAAPAEDVSEPTPVLMDEPAEEVVVKKEVVVEKKEEQKQSNEGKDQQTVQSAGGAITESKPDYLRNPAPIYPDDARRRGQQGVVLLNVLVDATGHPQKIDIKQSSGYRLLDEAAVKNVWQWVFQPAKLGSMPVESRVDVPIRFQLK